MGKKRKTTEEFIEEAKVLHGDKYDYSKVEYVNNSTKVTVICPIHGEIRITPKSHLKTGGCRLCGYTRAGKSNSKGDLFVSSAIKVHGIKYNYSKVEYVNRNASVSIICPQHGVFNQAPANHLQGQGCPECGKEIMRAGKIQPLKKVREDAITVHNGKYTYDFTGYIDKQTKIAITCPSHGIFYQTMASHVGAKQGCPKCARERIESSARKTKEEFTEEARMMHKDIYDYTRVVYINNSTNVIIGCPVHGYTEMNPRTHINGCGCPECCSHGFDVRKPAILYYLSINNGEAYKIGITNRTVAKRFGASEMRKIKVLKEWKYDSGEEAYKQEQAILKEFKWARYNGVPLLANGNTELFISDILQMDKGKQYDNN